VFDFDRFLAGLTIGVLIGCAILALLLIFG
jgi:hypothetical protein